MDFKDVRLPEIYLSSSDFRFFRDWFSLALSKIKYDTENFFDLYDPLKCPAELLWLLADTMGFKFDDRLCTAFNRLVLVYFMSMIRNRGSKDGVTLAAETNLAQFRVQLDASGYEDDEGVKHSPKDILYNRLEDTSIPVNSASVTPHVEDGYIDVVYFSEEKPVDACIEYVRPLGMYCFQYAGVRFDARTKISVDARLTDSSDIKLTAGSTRVGHYSREDYARLQKMQVESNYEGGHSELDYRHDRENVYRRNSAYESSEGGPTVNAGYRALYSLQLANNDHVIQALMPNVGPIFGLGQQPLDISVRYPDNYTLPDYTTDEPAWNLRYDKAKEESVSADVWTVDSGTIVNPYPAVNPPMFAVGDAISLNDDNTEYTKVTDSGIEKNQP